MNRDAVSCPFYGVSLHRFRDGGSLIPAHGNRCALITSAHSPCWMEVGEGRAPDWAACPRNPEFAAVNIFEGHPNPALRNPEEDARQEAETKRIVAALRHLKGLMRDRAAANEAKTP